MAGEIQSGDGAPRSQTMLPTTKAQVSGHRFLRRRIEHGVVLGDIRMLHDPLATRRRASIFGLVATVLIGAGAGLMAWLSPDADPGDAIIVRGDHGQLYTRIDGRYHPTANLASARLIAGSPDDPARIGQRALTSLPHGIPIGIDQAPEALPSADEAVAAADDHNPARWAACFDAERDALTVTADSEQTLAETAQLQATADEDNHAQAALVQVDGGTWLVNDQGRVELPPADDEFGRVIRRALGIEHDIKAWHVPSQLLNAWTVLPSFRAPTPDDAPTVLYTANPGRAWALLNETAVVAISDVEAEILAGMGAKQRQVSTTKINSFRDSQPEEYNWVLPSEAPEIVSPADGDICATDSGELAVWRSRDGEDEVEAQEESGAFARAELAGGAAADFYLPSTKYSRAVQSEHGYHVVSPSGRVHDVDSVDSMVALGASAIDGNGELAADNVPWAIMRLLPSGVELNQANALGAQN